MNTVLELLSGEVERLFSSAEMTQLCIDYLGVDPKKEGLEDSVKSAFAKRIVTYCNDNDSIEALADMIITLKKNAVDPRLQKFLGRTTAGDELRPHTDVGGYIVYNRIEENDIGVVYECTHADSASRYRLTVLRKDRAENRRAAQRYLMLMRLLKHNPKPSVASVKEAGTLPDGRPYAVSVAVEGKTAAEAVPMSPLKALALLEGIMDALEPLHAKGIYHGNLKTDNIVMLNGDDDDDELEVVLTDLGADRLVSPSAPPIGIAPEMLRHGKADLRADIYALGALLYEMVVGKPMFKGALAIDASAAHLVNAAPAVSASSDEPAAAVLDKFVAHLAAKDPISRPKNLDQTRRKLEEVKRSVEQLEAQAQSSGTRDDIGPSVTAFLQNPADEATMDEFLADARTARAWGAAVEVIEEAASTSEDPDLARRLLLTAADIAFERVKDFTKALSLYEYFLSADPDDAEVLTATLKVLEAAGRYEELVEKLTGKAEATEAPAERISLMRRIAEVYDKKLKNAESAFGYYAACLTGTADDESLLEPLERNAAAAGQHETLAASLGQAAQTAETAGDTDTALLLYEALAPIYLNKLDQAGYALTCYQKVLQFRPDDVDTMKAVAELYRGAQQWDELAQVTMGLAEMESQPNLRRNHLAEAADILYRRSGNTEQAMPMLDAVLAEDPGHAKALDTLTAILEAAQDYARLTTVLNDSLQSISNPAEQVGVRARLGALCEQQLGDMAAAKNHYELAVAHDPKCLEALKGLDRIYLKEGAVTQLRANLEAQLACEMSPKQAAEIRVRLADLYEEEFKEYGKATEQLEAVLSNDDTHRYALLTLTRLYRRQERWEDLVSLLEKRAKLAADEEKKSLLKERAEVIRDKLKDAARAIQALTEVSSLGVDDALETLARAQEDAGNYEAAVETLGKIADAAQEIGAKQTAMLRIAAVQLEKIGDLDDTVLTLRKARELNPANRDVLSLLSRAMISKQNFAEALSTLEQQSNLEDSPSGKADIFATMGRVCLDNLGDAERALNYLRQAVALDESNFEATFKLVKVYRHYNAIDEAIPLYRRLGDAAGSVDAPTQVEIFSDMGDTYAAAERMEDAFKAYSRAVAVQGVPIAPELMAKYAEAGFDREAFEAVQATISEYLNSAGSALPGEIKEPLLILLARAYLKLDNHIDAHKILKEVLTLSPTSLDARALIADVHEQRGEYKQMVDSLTEVIAAMPDGDDRKADLMRRAGAVLADKLQDVEGGVRLLKQALAMKENDRAVLAELLKIFTASKKFDELVEVILRIAEQVEDPTQKVRYYISAAKVYRRELGDINKAVALFEKALEIHPQDPDANRAIVETLEKNGAWDKLELHYKKLIARLPKDAVTEDRLLVLKPLFELLGQKLKKKADAAVIGEAIFKLTPDDEAHAEKLAELYGWEVEFAPKAIELHRDLLAKNAGRSESVRQMYRIFSAQGNPDKTWCAASVLSLLNACTPEEHRYYKDYRPSDLQTFTNVLDGDQWLKHLYPKGMDHTVTSIFAIIQDAIFKAKGQPLSRYGLDLSQAVDVTQSQYTAAAFVNFAAGTLGMAPPPFFFLQGAAPGFQLLETAPPVLVSDGDESALTDRVGVAFVLGQQLSLFQPGLFVSQMMASGTEMLSWLLASIRMFVPTLPVPDNIAGQISDKLTPLRSGLDDAAMERLQGHVHTFVSTSSAEVNLKKWAKHVALTQDRAGLALCGDLPTAVKVLRERVQDEKQLADRLRAITLFALSDHHFALRAHLGSALRSA